MRAHFMYLNGVTIPTADAAISPMDIGLLRGYSVFDLLRTVHGRPFLLTEHLQRLHASAEQLGLRVPVTDAHIAEAIDDLLARNHHEGEATVRLVLTGGVSPDGMGFDPESPTFYITTADLHEPPASLYETGAKVVMQEHLREFFGAKTTNYLTMLKHRPRALAAGATDLLYHSGGRILEAASASFYLVRGTTILAPSDHVLWGTIGSLVLKLAEGHYDVAFGEVTLEDAKTATEAFLTSTTRGILPIVMLDDSPVGDGTVGPVTRDLMAIYHAAVFGTD